uniref:Spermatogenesis-associated protein 22 n=1 Tax=Knipowitschia caucasica TaxID=637954 RepID=A0AAV2J8B4_KNICA
MRRQANNMSFPTVPLFNQKKRARVPLTSAPPANESYSFNDYNADVPHTAPGTLGFYHSPETRKNFHQEQKVHQSMMHQQRQYSGTGPRAAATSSQYGPLPHPYKAVNTNTKMEQTNFTMRQKDVGAGENSQFNTYQPRNNRSGPSPRQPPPAQAASQLTQPKSQQQSKAWNLTNSFGPQPAVLKKATKPVTPNIQVKAQPKFQMRSTNEVSLRILTAVIDGMRHWSQFKDKVPFLFEIFATLDSAVTLGPHGAKNFIIRDGKEVVQCVYYENEKELPRLIRGQVHRCVGNYDRTRNVLVCVSIRPALPSELRNSQEAVRVCDAEMRVLVKHFSEV